MKEDMKSTLVFEVKDLRHEDFKRYEALVAPETLGLIYEEADFVSPLSCTVLLCRQGDNNIFATADITSTLSVECRRCVKVFNIDVATTLNLFFSFRTKSLESDEADERYYDGETLDISEDVRQDLIVEMPMWPLCADTCEGLCPGCGANLNDGICACNTENEEPVSTSNPLSAQLTDLFSKADPLKDARK